MNDQLENILTDKEMTVVDYIRGHPNCIKQDIADFMSSEKIPIDHRAARATVWDILLKLKEMKVVDEYPDAENRHTKRLALNKDSVMNTTLEQLRLFERAFFGLTRKLKIVLSNEPFAPVGSHPDETIAHFIRPGSEPVFLIMTIFNIFYKMVETIHFQSWWIWPIQIPDNEKLKQLYSTAFLRIARMQARLFHEWKTIDPHGNLFSDVEMARNFRTDAIKEGEKWVLLKYHLLHDAASVFSIIVETQKLGAGKTKDN